MVDQCVADSWAGLHELLFEHSWHRELGRFRSPFAFRGLGSARYELTTSLARLGAEPARVEVHLLRNFRKYARVDAVREDLTWNWLALAQHHGLPTRLLDWTFSPFVALHIATEAPDLYGSDSVIWCVDHAAVQADLPPPLRQLLDEEGSDVFTAEMLGRAATGLRDFDALAQEPFAIFFEPPSLDERIVNQFALFSLMSSPDARLDDWLVHHPGRLARRILLPAALKQEVRDKLDQANITERVLYPGLEGLSRWLRRYYGPAPTHRNSNPEPPRRERGGTAIP